MKLPNAVILCLAVILSSPALGAVINVPGDYSAIQLAIDTAANGDTVLVQPGTYIENINKNTPLLVLRQGGGFE